jgi:hypothetical protein
VDLSFSPDDDAFRDEVRGFIRDHYPAEMRVKNPYSEPKTRFLQQFGTGVRGRGNKRAPDSISPPAGPTRA